jgi:hypothetical protein
MIPLETVLMLRGAERDRHDKSKWHSERGPLTVTGPKFMNWHLHEGGGGAIDLVMHLAKLEYPAAVQWLKQSGAGGYVAVSPTTRPSSAQEAALGREAPNGPLRLPTPDERRLGGVLEYLTGRRHLAPSLLDPLLESGRLYADQRGNAVFLLVAGKAQRPVGAELRGTGPQVWRGMAPGTRKDSGCFWIGVRGSQELVLCESAIDAIRCCQIHPGRICISTSGARANPRWLPGLIARGYQIHCGFDTDQAGDEAAARMITLYPAVQRLRPPAHDWNDALASGH